MEQVHELKHEGNVLHTGTYNECLIKLQRFQPHSWDYAMKYGGYTIEPKKQVQVEITWIDAEKLSADMFASGSAKIGDFMLRVEVGQDKHHDFEEGRGHFTDEHEEGCFRNPHCDEKGNGIYYFVPDYGYMARMADKIKEGNAPENLISWVRADIESDLNIAGYADYYSYKAVYVAARIELSIEHEDGQGAMLYQGVSLARSSCYGIEVQGDVMEDKHVHEVLQEEIAEAARMACTAVAQISKTSVYFLSQLV